MALARSVAKRPKVLLLDEPLGALDKKLREETQFELMDLQQKLGLTFVVVTHDQEEAMTMADRIAVMDKGKVDAGGDAGRDLRGAELALRRRLRRQREHVRGHGRQRATATGASIAGGDGADHPHRERRRRAEPATRSPSPSGRRRSGSRRSRPSEPPSTPSKARSATSPISAT